MKNADIINDLLFQPDLKIIILNLILLKGPIGCLNSISIVGIIHLTLQNYSRRNNCDLLESPLRYRYKDSTRVYLPWCEAVFTPNDMNYIF